MNDHPAFVRRKLGLLWAVVFGLLPLLAVAGAQAAPPRIVSPTLTVNSLADNPGAAPLNDGVCATAYPSGHPNGVCSLRAAIMEANHWPGDPATIVLPALPPGQSYALGITAAGPDDEGTGDLNITASVTLVGGGASRTIISAQLLASDDRVLAVGAGTTVRISGVTLMGGDPEFDGGGVFNAGRLTLD